MTNRTRLTLFLFFISLLSFAQTKFPTYYMLQGHSCGEEITVQEIHTALRLDTTAKSKDLQVYMAEFSGSVNGKIVVHKFKSLEFSEKLKAILREARTGDRIFFDIKVKDKAGKIFTLPTQPFKIK